MSIFTAFHSSPYQVVESGYGGFIMPIDIYFKISSNEIRRIRTMYTLYLGVSPTVSHLRKEVITFSNLSLELYNRLIQAGAVDRGGINFVSDSSISCKRQYQVVDLEVESDYNMKKRRKQVQGENENGELRKRGRPKKESNKQIKYKQIHIDHQFKKVKTSFYAEKNTNEVKENFEQSNMDSFIRNVNKPLMTSTPTKNPLSKNNLKLKYKSFIRETSFEEEEKILINEDVHKYTQSLLNLPQHRDDKKLYENTQSIQNRQDIQLLLNVSKKLEQLKDRKKVKKIISLIKSTGNYSTNSKSFDFDLCKIDSKTLLEVVRLLNV